MNLFMPYKDIQKSVHALDDKRLNKQILECYQILQVALGRSHGYENHPVVKHYKDYAGFVSFYGEVCTTEFYARFHKMHSLWWFFATWIIYIYGTNSPNYEDIKYNLIYAEYTATDPRCIRETNTERVTALFRDKLVRKWKQDVENGRPPKWTNRQAPAFWVENK